MDQSHYINVKFLGGGFSQDEQGKLLLAFEQIARGMTKKPAEVFLAMMADDSKLRRGMTRQEKATL